VSVTIKLADADAKLVGDLLNDLCKLNKARIDGRETVPQLKNIELRIPNTVMLEHVQEIVGAFQTAVRANK